MPSARAWRHLRVSFAVEQWASSPVAYAQPTSSPSGKQHASAGLRPPRTQQSVALVVRVASADARGAQFVNLFVKRYADGARRCRSRLASASPEWTAARERGVVERGSSWGDTTRAGARKAVTCAHCEWPLSGLPWRSCVRAMRRVRRACNAARQCVVFSCFASGLFGVTVYSCFVELLATSGPLPSVVRLRVS